MGLMYLSGCLNMILHDVDAYKTVGEPHENKSWSGFATGYLRAEANEIRHSPTSCLGYLDLSMMTRNKPASNAPMGRSREDCAL